MTAGPVVIAGPVVTAGVVFLVGAGPGDPGLLTVRGAQLLARADVVVHDRLTGAALLALAPVRAERVDVGKQPDDRGDQDEINRLLVTKAQAGLRVVRLKGGDPFVFGRGGEEAMALAAAGVRYEVVPGVTSAIAAPAYAGVPVTHRGLVTSFTVVAGHTRSVEGDAGHGGTNWEALAQAGGTIVVLMGAAHRGPIAERLMAGGLSPATPVTAVQWGTEARQRTTRTTLGQLGATVVGPPVTMVIGEVAGLDLGWYDDRLVDRPLLGQTVVVTRAEHQAPALAQRLGALGANVLELPVVAVAPAADGGQALAAAVDRMSPGAYRWLVLTSANAVHHFFALVPDTRRLGAIKVAAVGPATAAALAEYRVVADLVPPVHSAQGLVAVFPGPGAELSPRRVLLPQAAGAGPGLRTGLEAQGWDVDLVEAYRTVPHDPGAGMLAQAAAADAICFASSSAVDSYLDQAGDQRVPPVVACIGPATARTAGRRGLTVTAQATEHSLDGLVDALVSALTRPGPASARHR